MRVNICQCLCVSSNIFLLDSPTFLHFKNSIHDFVCFWCTDKKMYCFLVGSEEMVSREYLRMVGCQCVAKQVYLHRLNNKRIATGNTVPATVCIMPWALYTFISIHPPPLWKVILWSVLGEGEGSLNPVNLWLGGNPQLMTPLLWICVCF